MATSMELELFDEQLREVASLPEASRWVIERDTTVELGLTVVMHSSRKPDDHYKARIRWTNLFGPFSLKFIDMNTGSDCAPTAWPVCAGFSPPNLFACLTLTKEGHDHHPEWKNNPATRFPETDAPVQLALVSLQAHLDTTYQGRHQ